jgi:uncharacterized membrane protein SirB2
MDNWVKTNLGEEYIPLTNDILKFTSILIVLNILMWISNPTENTLLGEKYLTLIIYFLLGLITYHLLIKQLE